MAMTRDFMLTRDFMVLSSFVPLLPALEKVLLGARRKEAFIPPARGRIMGPCNLLAGGEEEGGDQGRLRHLFSQSVQN